MTPLTRTHGPHFMFCKVFLCSVNYPSSSSSVLRWPFTHRTHNTAHVSSSPQDYFLSSQHALWLVDKVFSGLETHRFPCYLDSADIALNLLRIIVHLSLPIKVMFNYFTWRGMWWNKLSLALEQTSSLSSLSLGTSSAHLFVGCGIIIWWLCGSLLFSLFSTRLVTIINSPAYNCAPTTFRNSYAVIMLL